MDDLTPARLREMAAMDDTDLVWELQGFGCGEFRALAARVIELEEENARLKAAMLETAELVAQARAALEDRT